MSWSWCCRMEQGAGGQGTAEQGASSKASQTAWGTQPFWVCRPLLGDHLVFCFLKNIAAVSQVGGGLQDAVLTTRPTLATPCWLISVAFRKPAEQLLLAKSSLILGLLLIPSGSGKHRKAGELPIP